MTGESDFILEELTVYLQNLSAEASGNPFDEGMVAARAKVLRRLEELREEAAEVRYLVCSTCKQTEYIRKPQTPEEEAAYDAKVRALFQKHHHRGEHDDE